MRVVAAAAAAGLALAPLAASAQNPHFVRCSAELVGEDLRVSFKEAGLGTNEEVTIVASAFATADYACRNKAGKFPQGVVKQDEAVLVSESGTFNSGKNGNVEGSLLVQPPEPGENLNCGPAQEEVLVAVSYEDIIVEDTTNGVAFACTPSSLSATFVTVE